MLGAHQGSHSCSHLCCFPVGESLHRVKHSQAVPLFVSLALRHSSPPAPTCGPCEVARLRQSADQCCPEYECGTWPALGAAPPSTQPPLSARPRRSPGAEAGVWAPPSGSAPGRNASYTGVSLSRVSTRVRSLQTRPQKRWEVPLTPARSSPFSCPPITGLGSRYRCALSAAPSSLGSALSSRLRCTSRKCPSLPGE